MTSNRCLTCGAPYFMEIKFGMFEIGIRWMCPRCTEAGSRTIRIGLRERMV